MSHPPPLPPPPIDGADLRGTKGFCLGGKTLVFVTSPFFSERHNIGKISSGLYRIELNIIPLGLRFVRFINMGEFLLIILLLFVAYNLAQDVHQRLKVQFVHELARNGGSRWKSVTILYYENAINSDKNDWIFDIEIPKEYFDMSMDDGTNLSKHTDAYIIIANENSNADTAKESIRNLLTLKQAVDSTKTFIIFSRNIYDVLLKITDIDLILIEQKYHWDPNTKTIDKPILEFQRFRSLSTLEPSGMTGVYEGTALKEEQRRILFDRSFSYGNRQVKVTTFPVPPTTIECKQEKDKFCGRDPELVAPA